MASVDRPSVALPTVQGMRRARGGEGVAHSACPCFRAAAGNDVVRRVKWCVLVGIYNF